MNLFRSMLCVCVVSIFALTGCFPSILPDNSSKRPTAYHSTYDKKYYNFVSAQLELKKGNIDQAIVYMTRALQSDPDSLYLKRELAFLYVEKEDYTSALDVFSYIIEKDPNNVEALIMLGRIKQAQKKFAEAITAYLKVLKLDPKQHDIYLLLGGLYIEKNDTMNALRTFHKMIAYFPDSFTAYYFLGKIYMEEGNIVQAEKQFYKTLKYNPDLLEPKFELAALYQMEKFQLYTAKKDDTLEKIAVRFFKKYDKHIADRMISLNLEIKDPDAIKPGQKIRVPVSPTKSIKERLTPGKRKKIIQLYNEILESDPYNIRAMMELAYFYDRLNMKTDAAKLYIELGNRSSTETGVFIQLVNHYLEKKRYEATVAITEGMLKGAPQNSDLHHIAGLAYEGLENDEKAISHFKQVADGSRFFDDSVVHIAYLYQQNNQTDQAIDYLEAITANHPENTEFMLFLGSLYEDVKAFEKAEAIFKKALSIKKDDVKILFRLGVVYDKWGKKKECIRTMKRVIKIDPKHASALNYLGYTYAELGENLDEAERLILEALKSKPNDGYITDSLGWVYYKKGLFEKALETLQKAVSLVPDDPTMLEHLGDAHFQLNHKAEALKFYKMSLDRKDEEEETNKGNLEKKIKELTDQGF